LPIDFFTARLLRKLTVTLAYFSPIVASVQKYRGSHLWFSLENNGLFPTRVNTDASIVKRGTVQHEIFYGENAFAWGLNNSVKIKVNCAKDAASVFPPVKYALFVTFEVAEGIGIDIYNLITTRINEMIAVRPVAEG
jgi:hypothetical protein